MSASPSWEERAGGSGTISAKLHLLYFRSQQELCLPRIPASPRSIDTFPGLSILSQQSNDIHLFLFNDLPHLLQTSTMAEVSPESAGEAPPSTRAAQYLAQDQFHRRFVLPATADHGELQVSYADVGRVPKPGEDGTHHPTILFIPGLFASRFLGVWMHAVAEKLGVRVLIVDR